MSAFGIEGFASISDVPVDIYTDTYRISGIVKTPFTRVAEIINQLPSEHLPIERATISEHGEDANALGAPAALVAIDEILLMVAPSLEGTGRSEMRIEKRKVRALLAIPPFRVTGMVHVPIGSRPVDGLLMAHDRFMTMTEVTIASATHPHLDRAAVAVAMRRDRAHVLLVVDDERPDELLSDVLDQQTAERWLHPHGDEG
jgi:hypothetical protein